MRRATRCAACRGAGPAGRIRRSARRRARVPGNQTRTSRLSPRTAAVAPRRRGPRRRGGDRRRLPARVAFRPRRRRRAPDRRARQLARRGAVAAVRSAERPGADRRDLGDPTVRRSILVAGGAIGLSLLAIGVAAGANDSGDDSGWSEVADHAREQMASHAFDGVVVVEWQDENGSHRADGSCAPTRRARRGRLGRPHGGERRIERDARRSGLDDAGRRARRGGRRAHARQVRRGPQRGARGRRATRRRATRRHATATRSSASTCSGIRVWSCAVRCSAPTATCCGRCRSCGCRSAPRRDDVVDDRTEARSAAGRQLRTSVPRSRPRRRRIPTASGAGSTPTISRSCTTRTACSRCRCSSNPATSSGAALPEGGGRRGE